jgi:hypothetical protein
MAYRMTFEQLYKHMETYISSPDDRWKHVTRVKRGISNPNEIGCYSRDQSYFEGAIEILENLDEIDFDALMSGKLCVDELNRVRRLARTSALKLPKFMMNSATYREKLREIGITNGILKPPPNKINNLYEDNENLRRATSYEVNKYIDNAIEMLKPPEEIMHTSRTNRSIKGVVKKDVNPKSTSVCVIL